MALNMYLLEGQQAEEYKKRKAEEKENSENNYFDRNRRRGQDFDPNDNSRQYRNRKSSTSKADYESKERAAKAVNRESDKRIDKLIDKPYTSKDKGNAYNLLYNTSKNDAADAYRRHERRHGVKEAGILSDVEII